MNVIINDEYVLKGIATSSDQDQVKNILKNKRYQSFVNEEFSNEDINTVYNSKICIIKSITENKIIGFITTHISTTLTSAFYDLIIDPKIMYTRKNVYKDITEFILKFYFDMKQITSVETITPSKLTKTIGIYKKFLLNTGFIRIKNTVTWENCSYKLTNYKITKRRYLEIKKTRKI